MLSERERQILHDMQRRLEVEDPDFARSFEDAGARGDTHISLPRAHEVPRWVFTTALVLSVLLSVLMLVAMAPWPAALFMVVAMMFAAARLDHADSPTGRAVDGRTPG